MIPGSIKRRIQGVLFRMPMMITCRQFEEFIIDYLDGELDPHKRRVFEIHIMMCTECRAYLAAYKTSVQVAKIGLANDTSIQSQDVPEDLILAVMASLDEQESDDLPPETM